MLNYIKSEFYRVVHSLSTYVTLGVFAALSLLVNCGLAIFGAINPAFAYNTTSFSMQFLMNIPTVFVCAAPILVYVLYENVGKSGALKNAVAFGISREKLLLGQTVVSLVFCLAVLAVTEAVYFASAYAFLRFDPAISAAEVLLETACALPSALAALVLAVVCVNVSDRSFVGVLIWMAVFYLVPYVCRWVGYQVDFFADIAAWMPMNFMDMQNAEVIFWRTGEGVLKCLVAGGAGIVVFGAAGWLALRRKEI